MHPHPKELQATNNLSEENKPEINPFISFLAQSGQPWSHIHIQNKKETSACVFICKYVFTRNI